MLDEVKLANMILELKRFEANMDADNDRDVLKYIELTDVIIDYLKGVL